MRLALVLLSALASITPAQAQERRPVGDSAELAGCWKKIVFSEAARKFIPADAKLADPPHQVLCFDPDGTTFRMVGSAEPVNFEMPKDYAALARQPKEMSYEVPQTGLLVIGQDSTKTIQQWAASFFPADASFFGVTVPKNTLVMGLTDPAQPSKVVHWRYLTKIAPRAK
ncbi:hypothetical protein [Ideonella sp. A 288]|uniref:hypothetical protein n=1 Tax=Ideonella sp. A 288 TaxID=1962181 RepID=UPI000B4B46CA|nr:hypothetical protein [Ideonella sp. A 288]